ncbi:leucyl aminopeptidase [Leifsonia sp. 98AMF]|uniref:leucyl aminopeptidase n=1 Tax=unclassified Leifsonia TaxID=2663824 RepID=UPI00087937D2|nr:MULTISPECIES: leucyl aminopeptidase [unclassified Leifsonia]SDH41499.1 leucyl aminopeptidase [Leifsonia sp. 197AMF]SDI95276.1 leucyl aminopeptidase [Leifsonia sp. 466MF]SDJ81558.1 leucyl aminopeptidase [Leifsonia sp. 157MF]SDN98832.1 leucyl aminopeptidase [Leifsonia sp. 509MF]SEN06004.1 leucyl aminopeptidase [Leifsonia sp. 467MF]
MTVPALTVTDASTPSGPADVLVVAARVAGDSVTVLSGADRDQLAQHLRDVGFSGGKDELVRLPGQGSGPSLAVIGLPEGGEDALRYAAGSAVRQLAGTAAVALDLPAEGDAQLGAVLEGAALGAYAFTEYREKSRAATKDPVGSVEVLGAASDSGALIARATAVAEAAALVKDLVNTPPLDLYPETFAERAQAASSDLPVTVTVWDEEQLAVEGFGGILGVGQGSTRPPRLVKVAYSPDGAERHLALVGKGITFDSGGLSLKPATGMVGMKYDMTGAATVLGVVLAAARLALPVRVTAWLCLAENMPSGSAIRPNDVLRIRGGRTVEVLNTDAEGRLVLADGLVAASEEQPDAIVDVATLTGAAMVALGTRYAAVMGSDDLVDQVLTAGKESGELLWPMPLPGELRATINSDVADIANANPGNTAGGALLAGVFLQEFVGRTGDADDAPRIPWAHLDIAGPAKSPAAPYGFTGKGPSAVSVRALIRLAESFSRK